jgi:hypothetical protein
MRKWQQKKEPRGGAAFDTLRDHVRHIQSSLRLLIGRALPFVHVTATVGLFAEVTGVWQTVTVQDDEVATSPATPRRKNATPGSLRGAATSTSAFL